jgi:hypothetical protein
MARTLTIETTKLSADERAAFIDRARSRRGHFRGSGCHYWLFEEAETPGTFIEFTEGPDETTLRSAHASAPEPEYEAPLYVEVELI